MACQLSFGLCVLITCVPLNTVIASTAGDAGSTSSGLFTPVILHRKDLRETPITIGSLAPLAYLDLL